MPHFTYIAFDEKGKKQSGSIDATHEKEAVERLKEQGLLLAKLALKGAGKVKLNGAALLAFTKQLAKLLEAGLPLYESLVTLEEETKKETYHVILLSLSEDIKKGVNLSTAMSRYPKSFNTLYTSLIHAGEAVGSLDLVLCRLSTLLEKQAKLKKEVVSAMIYPSILALFSLLVIGLLLGFVVPSIEGMFQGKEINGFTACIIGASHLLVDHFLYWFIPFVTFVGYGTYWLRQPKGKIFLEKCLLKAPLIHSLVITASVARFCRTMGTLLAGGVSILEGLRLAKKTMQNVVLEQEITQAELRIIEGGALSKQLGRSLYIPELVTRMVKIGEETGDVKGMFDQLAEMYESDLEKKLSRLVNLAQPVILIIMGGIIGMIMMAVLLPLTQMARMM